eukprot:TRINITY_DN1737_c0_g1_i1.p1 TRINITY_DN1737_c0_g1~~TRINITY_DN1737_c0_g1_i1.p1  ORF type:complete len:233 (+),score=54.32 TRINITY_DN1737_c0_g1_i1:44-742(+)
MLLRSLLTHAANSSVTNKFGRPSISSSNEVGSKLERLWSSSAAWGSEGAFRHPEVHGTTVLSVRKGNRVVVIGDGQVTMGSQIMKPNVRKVRRLEGGNAIAGYAGTTADALALFDRLESKLEEHSGQLTRAAVELAKAWRMDKFLRKLDALILVADRTTSLCITGNGDILEPHDGIMSIGSGGPYALAAARALIDIPGMDAATIAKKSMAIAAESCIYTNSNFQMEEIVIDE